MLSKIASKKNLVLIMASVGIVALTGCQATSPKVTTDGNHVNVNNVDWQRQTANGYQTVTSNQLPNNMSRVVFVRPANNMADQSSANISLDNRYLVSLQGGNYTQTDICSGQGVLSVVPTGAKINDLQANAATFKFAPQQTYYFAVDVDKTTNQPTLTQLNPNNAQTLLAGKSLQTHQVSRIVNNCAPVVVQQPVVVAPVVVTTPAPKDIRLAIQFDTAKSVVKQQYKDEIADVARYLNQYPSLTAVVEGHTDNVGKDSSNQSLSQRRAEAVRQELIADGVNAGRLTAVGYGEARPVADNSTATGRAENRRVVVSTR